MIFTGIPSSDFVLKRACDCLAELVSKSKKLLANLVTLTILPLAALSIALASLKGFSLCKDLWSSVISLFFSRYHIKRLLIDDAIRYFGKVCSFVVESFFLNLVFGSVSIVMYL